MPKGTQGASAPNSHPDFKQEKMAIVLVDVSGFARACAALDDSQIPTLACGLYERFEKHLSKAGARIVKYMGDACFAVGDPDSCALLTNALVELKADIEAFATSIKLHFSLEANLHVANIMTGHYELNGTPFFDIFGNGVNFTATMGRGAGIRLSENAYRKLPSNKRSPWKKQTSPATYAFVG